MTMRVLHCPSLIGGNAPALAQQERTLGLQSHCVAFEPSPFGYPADDIIWSSTDSHITRERARWTLARSAARDYDVIHYNFGRSLMPTWRSAREPDLDAGPGPLMKVAYSLYSGVFEFRDVARCKRAGKAVFVTFQGDDARQGDYLAQHFDISPTDEVGPDYYTKRSDDHKRHRIRRWARYADGIYALNPDLLHVLPEHAKFMPYAHVDPRDWRSIEREPNERPVVLHAPTHRGVKGTPHVLAAVERLQAEGVDFEFVLVEGKTQAEARRLYERADLLVDQLLIGWYGGLAVELMALGVPVICYIRESDLGGIPAGMRDEMPIINASPATIEDTLREWLTTRRDELVRRGAESRAYMERWHDPRRIAGELKADYERVLGQS